jgi:hypothetical protein
MYTISFDKEALNVTIHNLCPGLELTSPVYYSNGTPCHVSTSQQTEIGNILEASFGIDSRQKDFKGALLCKLQRTYDTISERLLHGSRASIRNIAENVYLLVVWDVENVQHDFYACLIECTPDFTWDEDKLWALYREYNHQFCKNYKSNMITWLIYVNKVVRTKFDITYGSDYKLDITIFEKTGKYDMKRPTQIDSTGLVLLLLMMMMMMMMMMLICMVRLPIKPSVKLNIHNQCSNVDLVSLMYTTGHGLECHMAPNHQVYAGDIMKSGFVSKSSYESYGALIYRLQRRQSHASAETGEDTLSATQLLVVWKVSGPNELYRDVLLVEHDKGFDKDNLENLYRRNINQLRLYPVSAIETWLLNDNTVLKNKFEITNGGPILNITISEVDKDDFARAPVYIDPER